MILIIKDGRRLCNDNCWRSFAMFGSMPGCVKVYQQAGRARTQAARIGGKVAVIPPGMAVEAGGSVIETVPDTSRSTPSYQFVNYVRHGLEEYCS